MKRGLNIGSGRGKNSAQAYLGISWDLDPCDWWASVSAKPLKEASGGQGKEEGCWDGC